MPPSQLNRSLSIVEVVFCAYGLLFYTEFWWSIIGESLGPVMGLIRYSILIFSVVFLCLRWQTLLKVAPKGKWLWLLFGLCALSFTWSTFPDLTAEGIIQSILQVGVFSLYFTSRFNPKHQLYIIATAMTLTVLCNLFYVVAMPSVGMHVGDKFDGAWKGYYDNKNEFSGKMLWSLIVFYLLTFKGSNQKIVRFARLGVFLCPILIILSTSKTALVLLIFLYATLTLWQKYRWVGEKTILTLDLASLSLLVLIGGIINSWVALVSGLGKDPTMSGRTDIWTATMIQVNRRPILGHGFSGFWTEDNPAAQEIGDYLHPGFYTYNAHNGFLDILLDSGWLGMLLFMIGFLSTWMMALKYAYRPQSPEDCWPLAVMLLVTSYNMTESSFLTDNLNWLFYVIAYLSMRIWPRSLPEPTSQSTTQTPSTDSRSQAVSRRVERGLRVPSTSSLMR